MEPNGNDGWRIIGSEVVIETPYLRMRRDEIELPSGEHIEYYVRESRGFTIVFALTVDDQVF